MVSSSNGEKKSVKTAGRNLLRMIFIIVLLNGNILAVESQDGPQAPLPFEKKQVPRIAFKNLSPPYKDYDYLKGHQAYPFQAGATAFNLINAWWLAEISTLVYADEDFVNSRFSRAPCRSRNSLYSEARRPKIRFFAVGQQ